jgi:hypothetical protein
VIYSQIHSLLTLNPIIKTELKIFRKNKYLHVDVLLIYSVIYRKFLLRKKRAMANSIETWLSIIYIGALICFARWRWSEVNKCTITNEQYDKYSQILLEDLFAKASRENKQIRTKNTYWQNYKLSKGQLVYLCRSMQGNGLIKTPDNWGFIDILFDHLPESLALTTKSMSLMMFNKQKLYQNISIMHNNAPVNIQGQQTIISGQTLSNDNLCQLAEALRFDATNLPKIMLQQPMKPRTYCRMPLQDKSPRIHQKLHRR